MTVPSFHKLFVGMVIFQENFTFVSRHFSTAIGHMEFCKGLSISCIPNLMFEKLLEILQLIFQYPW